MIYKEINFSNFVDEFQNSNYKNNFTYNGLSALYDFLEELSDNENIELDIIAICCDYTEYNDIEEYLNNYNTTIDKDDYEEEADYFEAVKEYIRDNTTLIEIEGTEGFIIQNY